MSFLEADLKDSFRNLIESRVWLLLTRISNFLAEQGIESYIVGGLVRDVVLRRDTADIDIAVATDAPGIAAEVADELGGKYVLLDSVNRVGRVVLPEEGTPSTKGQRVLDFSTFKGSIEQDLARRDFTVDAMAIDLNQLIKDFSAIRLIDPFNGWDDLGQGVIRAVADTAFTSDAVRLLRAMRLASELGFSIDGKTESLIQSHCHLIASVAGERVREEVLRLLNVSGSGQFLPYLDKLGLLMAVFPELAQTKGVEQPKEHFWNVFEHSLKTVIAVDFLLRQGGWEYADEEVLATVPWSEALAQHFDLEVSSGSTRRSLLKLAALLHDIAKPQTKAIESDGRMRFLGHAEEGATIAAGMLERLRFSTKEIKLVETVIRYHLRPGQMSNNDELPTHRAIYRYFRDTAEAGIDILFLSLADHLATRGPHLNLSHWREHTQEVAYVLAKHFQEESIVQPPKLVNGHDIIKSLGMPPGPKIGEILEIVREARASGELTTREEALAYIRKLAG